MIEANIICDSLNPFGVRLTTYVLKYPRFIHSEVMTHRMFSRNAASSRAIPVSKIISDIRATPAMPVYWGKNQKGMQAEEELPEETILEVERIWLESMESQIRYANELSHLGVHKQITNRLLEPFFHITTLLTATDFANFFNLRAHKDAQPEFQELAFLMLEAYYASSPKQLAEGQWHLPFSDKYVEEGLTLVDLLKISTARAARVSYVNFMGDIDYEKDYKLHDDLVESGHWSPFEHPAQAQRDTIYRGNFRGYTQYRKLFSNENRTNLNAMKLRAERKHYGRKKNYQMGKVG